MAVEGTPSRGRQLRVVGVGVGLAVLGVLVGTGLGGVVGRVLFVGGQLGVASTAIVVTMVTELGGYAGVAAAYVGRFGWPWRGRDWRPPSLRQVGWVGVGILALVGVQTGAGAVLSQLGVAPAPNVTQQLGERTPQLALWFIPVSFLVIGPAEELLFRGVIQGRLREVFRPEPAIVLASVIFALPHLGALATGTGGSALATVAVVFVVSLGLGVAYERTSNLVVPALLHGGYNAVLFGSLYVILTTG